MSRVIVKRISEKKRKNKQASVRSMFPQVRWKKKRKERKRRKLTIMGATKNGRWWFSVECTTESQQWGKSGDHAWRQLDSSLLTINQPLPTIASFDKRRASRGERPYWYLSVEFFAYESVDEQSSNNENSKSGENFPEVSFHLDRGTYLENRCVECVYYLLGQMNFLESPAWAGILNFQGAVVEYRPI